MGQSIRKVIFFVCTTLMVLPGYPEPAAADKTTLVFGGDIQWPENNAEAAGIFFHPRPQLWDRALTRVPGWHHERELVLPYVFHDDAELAQKIGRLPIRRAKAKHGLSFQDQAEELRYPFLRIASVLRQADIAFANLEMPLSGRGRLGGLQRDGQDSVFRGAPAFAEVLAWAGIDVVSTANNHALDAGEEGLFDTRTSLLDAGVQPVGSGRDLDEARRAVVLERRGVRCAFLAYSMVDQSRSGYALRTRSGIAPLDPFLVQEDISKAVEQADYVVVSLHWGKEDSRTVSPSARRLAQSFVDTGAHIVVGHHPHVPSAVETYKNGVILYSLGNFIFGHYRTAWTDNILARVILSDDSMVGMEILPIAGTGRELAQPALLADGRAEALLQDIAERSAKLGTRLRITGELGVIELPSSLR
jgi:poly-gamma-glutamate synthesis protein (capsule biosynthesis protein)